MNGNMRIALVLTCVFMLIGQGAAFAAAGGPVSSAPTAGQSAPRAAMSASETAKRAGPSFNCAKASNAVERTVCAEPALADLDLRVAEEYKRALGLHTDKEALKANQRQWLREMHNQCATAPSPCAQKYYKVRLAQLVQHNEQAARPR